LPGLLLDQRGGRAQLAHLLAELRVLPLQQESLLADADAVVPGRGQSALQPARLLPAALQLLAAAGREDVLK